jgi:site-specific DNA recombinase
MSKRVGLLARVSGHSQEDNTSLSNQLAKTRAWAVEQGYEIVTERIEVITGKARWGARSGFNELLAMGDTGTLNAVVIDHADRLGRGRSQTVLVERAHRHNLAVLVVSEGGELDDTDLAIGMLKSGEGRHGEQSDIARRTREGKLRTAENGGIVFATAPYGYRICKEYDSETGKKIRSWVEIDPEEKPHVVDMFEWLVCKRESLHGIRARLFRDRVYPRGIKHKMLKRYGEILPWNDVPDDLVDSRLWSRGSIRRILVNPVYTGTWYYNRRITKRDERGDKIVKVIEGERPRDEWIPIEVEPIVPEELFERARAILRKNQEQFAGRPPDGDYLLRGMLFCPCGRRMSGGIGKYRCTRIASRIEGEGCSTRIGQKRIENFVWSHVEGLLDTPKILLAGVEEASRQAEKINAAFRERIEYLRGEIAKADLRLERLLDLYLDGGLIKKDYQQKKKEIEDTTRDARLELTTAEAWEIPGEPMSEEEKLALVERFSKMRPRHYSFEEKRQLLLALDMRVTIYPEEDKVKMEYVLPTEELSMPR